MVLLQALGLSGWAVYVAWHQDDTGENGEPSDEVIEAHRRMSRLIAKLTCYYSALFGIEVNLNTALELADIERRLCLQTPLCRGARRRGSRR